MHPPSQTPGALHTYRRLTNSKSYKLIWALSDRYFDASRTAQGHFFSSEGKQLTASGVGAHQSPRQVSENSAGAVCGRRIRYSILNGGILKNATALLPYFYH